MRRAVVNSPRVLAACLRRKGIPALVRHGWQVEPLAGQLQLHLRNRCLRSDRPFFDRVRSRTEWPLAVRVSDAGRARAVDPGKGRRPASESLRRTNPRDSGEQLAVYGELIARRRWQWMVLRRLAGAERR